MGKLFTSISSLWVLFIPLLTVSKVGIVDLIEDCQGNSTMNRRDVIMLIKQLGELKEHGLITEEEFEATKHMLLDNI